MRGVDARRAFLQYDCIFIEIALFSDFTVLYCEARRLTVPVKRHRGEPGHARDTRAQQYCTVFFFRHILTKHDRLRLPGTPHPFPPRFPRPHCADARVRCATASVSTLISSLVKGLKGAPR